MTEFSSNLTQVIAQKLTLIKELNDNPDILLRAVAFAVLPELKKRVHVRGLDAAGDPIGVYSPEYMKVRTGNFQNAARVTRGPDKGQFKTKKSQAKGDAGQHTRGGKAGINRPVYNRTSDTKVILSLTRQMEEDLSLIDTPTGYGIGYLNPHNYEKALWCEATYGRPILTKLTPGEHDLAQTTAREFIPAYLK